MKQAAIALSLVLILFSCVLVWVHYRSRDYREAEPLVQLIWPLAYELERYFGVYGTNPNSLEELSAFAQHNELADVSDFSPLTKYEHYFYASGERRFYLRANGRYSFEVDASFTPSWVLPIKAEQPETLKP